MFYICLIKKKSRISHFFLMDPQELFDAILSISGSNDSETIKKANDFLVQRMMTKPLEFIHGMIFLLIDVGIDEQYLLYILVNFSNSISTRIRQLGFFLRNWEKLKIDENLLHQRLIFLLNHQNNVIRQNAAFATSLVANIELRNGLWDDFFPFLFETLNNPENSMYVIDGAFQVFINLLRIGLITTDIPNFQNILQNIYGILKIYLCNPKTDPLIRKDCLIFNCKAFYLFDVFLNVQTELTGYINTLCNNLTIFDKEIHKLAYKALIKAFARHIEKLENIMPDVFNFVANDLISTDVEVRLMSINFWSNIAIAETDKHLHFIIKTSAETLVPILLSNFLFVYKPSNNDDINGGDFEENPIITYTMFCLRNFVVDEPAIVGPIIEKFIIDNFNPSTVLSEEQILKKTASLFSIYALLEFNNFFPRLSSLIPYLIEMATDTTNHLFQSISLFVLTKSFSNFPQLISDPGKFNIIATLVFKNLSNELNMESDDVRLKSLNLLSKVLKLFINDIMQSYLGQQYDNIYLIFEKAFQNPHFRDPPFIMTVYETMNEFVKHLPLELESNIISLLNQAHNNIINEMNWSRESASTYISMNCSLITTITFRIKHSVEPYIPQIMETFHRLLSWQDRDVYSEALITIDAFAIIMKNSFSPYYPELAQILLNILSTYQLYNNHSLVGQVITLIGDIFRYPSPVLQNYAQDFYTNMRTLFSENGFPKEFLPNLIDSSSSVVAQINENLNDYFFSQMRILLNAQKIPIDVSQNDDKDFAFDLYESIMYGYVISIQLVCDDKELILRNINQIFQAFGNMHSYCVMTTRCLDLFLKLLNELVYRCGYKFCKRLNTVPFIKEIFDYIKNLPDEDFGKKTEQIEKTIYICLQRKF